MVQSPAAASYISSGKKAAPVHLVSCIFPF